ncbi:C3 and PZP-like alpha-2-macroglobulin domain-containing protein 8 [Holothuria leucospilota]|uniref:C3 and PZP-like alpha-2-macroglobulin domain-containing protein 8 n=1 Tax=Holothuria leucospilota TaxID=206669 RepID=A0A9Q1BYV3_HOLLE|nr:C3 and PZP-like alpha-2-macroglobulin domain-containing protein 8 [Holothuria leucospilota]
MFEDDTDTIYYYRYLNIASTGSQRIHIEVKASNDAHIALSPSGYSYEFYEVVIGEWANLQSVIRHCMQCPGEITEFTQDYLSPSEFQQFWITFGSNGAIAVGRDDETTPFMEWIDPDPVDVQYLGYSTGWESKGEFRLCSFGR